MSLRFKMSAAIGAILLVVIAAYAAIAARGQAEQLRALAQREALLVASIAERAIARAMLEGKRGEVQAILEKIGEQPDLVAIQVLDPEGIVRGSARAEEADRLVLPAALRAQAVGPITVWDYAAKTVGVFRPIPNAPPCHACHGPAQPVLGFVHAAVSFAGAVPEVVRRPLVAILPAVLALGAAGLFIALYFSLAVGRRIERLSAAMSRVEAGDLAARVGDPAQDELGRLGKIFDAMAARLAEAKAQLESRHAEEVRRAEHLAALGKLAAGVAHEVNNPLAGMQNCVRILKKWAGEDARQERYLQMLEEGLGRIGRTVRQLLDFARESRPRIGRTHVGRLIERCLGLLAHELARAKITYSVSVQEGLPEIAADAEQLEQVLLNLLMNAVEAMSEGGQLAVRAALRPAPGGAVEIAVTDTGTGIAPEHLPRIFDPFFTTKEPGRGTGLGLSVSYGIVKGHGGWIEVESEPGKGSMFRIVLPAAGAHGG